MEDLIRRTVGPQIKVEVVGAGGLWLTKVDPAQLESALLNLSINARDAMPDGGRLTIETANKWLDDRASRERDLPPGQYLSICVTDTGSGISKEIADRIRSEEHTSELQSLMRISYAVFCLKKKNKTKLYITIQYNNTHKLH